MITMSLKGDKELIKTLRKLPDAVRRDVLVEALEAAAEPIADAARRKVDVDRGKLRASIKVRRSRARRAGPRVAVTTSRERAWYAGETYYGAFIEFGHFVGSRALGSRRRFVPARPFMRPAYDENRFAALVIARRVAARRLALVAHRVARISA